MVPVIHGFCRQWWCCLKFGPKIKKRICLTRGKGFLNTLFFFLLPFYFVSLSKAVIPAWVISVFQSGFCCFALLQWPSVLFCQIFPNFRRLPVVVVMGRTGGHRTRCRSVEVYDTWNRPVEARQEGTLAIWIERKLWTYDNIFVVIYTDIINQ